MAIRSTARLDHERFDQETPMKNLLRASALTFALGLSALAMTGHAIALTGFCTVFCYDPSTQTILQAGGTTTSAQCCSASYNPCPPGTNRGGSTFQPDFGPERLCAAPN
jgi:hypothetical protein